MSSLTTPDGAEAALPPGDSRRSVSVRRIDVALIAVLVALVCAQAFMFGGVTPSAHLAAVVLGIPLAALLGARAVLHARMAWSLALVAAGAFVLLVVAQTVPLGIGLIESIQAGTAETWRTLLSTPQDAAGDAALAARPLTLAARETSDQLRLLVVAFVILAATMQVARHRSSLQFLLAGLIGVTALVALVGIVQIASGTSQLLWSFDVGPRPTGGPFVHRGHFAQFVNLGLGAGFALLCVRLADRSPHRQHKLDELFSGLGQPGRQRDLWLLAFCVVCLVAVGLCRARNGVISMLVGGAVLTYAVGRTKFMQGVGWPLVGMLVAAFTAVLLLGFDPVYDRFTELTSEVNDDNYVRLAIWNDAIDMLAAYPITGAGFGSFEWTFPMFDTDTRPGTVQHAESLYVEFLAETGFVGGLLMVAAIGFVIANGVRRCRDRIAPIHAATFGLGFGLVALAFHQFTDFGGKTPAVAASAIVCAGAILGLGTTRELTGAAARWIGGGLGFGLAVALLLMLPGAIAEAESHAKQDLAEDRLTHALSAVITEPGDVELHAELLAVSREARDIARDAGLPEDGEQAYWHAAHHWLHAVAQEVEDLPDRNLKGLAKEHPKLAVAAREACAILLEGRVDTPTHGRTWSLYGQLQAEWLADPIGLEMTQRGAELEPHDPMTCSTHARQLLRADRAEESVEWFRRAIDVGGRWKSVFSILIDEFGREDLARQVAGDDWRLLWRLVGQLENTAKALVQGASFPLMGELAERHGKLLTAIGVARRTVLDRLTEVESSGAMDVNAWLIAARYSLAEKDASRAVAAYRQFLSLRPRETRYRIELADALIQLGNVKDARVELRRVLRAKPNNATARKMLADLPE